MVAGFSLKEPEAPFAVDQSITILEHTFAVVAGFNLKELELPVAVDLSNTIL